MTSRYRSNASSAFLHFWRKHHVSFKRFRRFQKKFRGWVRIMDLIQRKSTENLIKAREAQKTMKESSSTESMPSSTATSESPSLEEQRSLQDTENDPVLLVSTQPEAPSDSQPTQVDQPETTPRDDLRAHDDPEATPTSQENEPLSTSEIQSNENTSPRSPNEILEDFCQDWLTELDRDDKKSLGIFLCHNLVKHFGMNNTGVSTVYIHVYKWVFSNFLHM